MKIILGMLLAIYPFNVFAETNTGSDYLSQLVSKETKEVHSFSGAVFNVDLVDGKPNMTISYVKVVNGNPPVNEMSPILIERSGDDVTGEQAVLNQIDEITSLKNGNVIETNNDREHDDEDIPNSIRFNCLDSRGEKRLVLWLDRDTGFNFKTAYYDQDGKLIGLTYYTYLQINQGDDGDFHGPSHPFILRLDKSKFHKNVILSKVEEVESFDREIFSKIKNGLGGRFSAD